MSENKVPESVSIDNTEKQKYGFLFFSGVLTFFLTFFLIWITLTERMPFFSVANSAIVLMILGISLQIWTIIQTKWFTACGITIFLLMLLCMGAYNSESLKSQGLLKNYTPQEISKLLKTEPIAVVTNGRRGRLIMGIDSKDESLIFLFPDGSKFLMKDNDLVLNRKWMIRLDPIDGKIALVEDGVKYYNIGTVQLVNSTPWYIRSIESWPKTGHYLSNEEIITVLKNRIF